MSSRGFGCDLWAPVSDVYWVCVFGRERLVQKLASPLPHLAALRDAFAVCFPFWQFDEEEAKKVQADEKRFMVYEGILGRVGNCAHQQWRGESWTSQSHIRSLGRGLDLRLTAAGARGQQKQDKQATLLYAA